MYSTYIRSGQSTCIGNTYIHVQYIIIQVPYTELHVQKVIVIVTSLFMYLHVHVYLYNPNSMLSTGDTSFYTMHIEFCLLMILSSCYTTAQCTMY